MSAPAPAPGIAFTPFETRVEVLIEAARSAERMGFSAVSVAEASSLASPVVLTQIASHRTGRAVLATDPEYRGVQVPLEFWKLLAYVVADRLRVRTFLVTHSLGGLGIQGLHDCETHELSPAERVHAVRW